MTTRPYMQDEIINLLSKEIAGFRQECSGERTFPARSADASDDFIKETAGKVRSLMDIRERLETIFYGEIE